MISDPPRAEHELHLFQTGRPPPAAQARAVTGAVGVPAARAAAGNEVDARSTNGIGALAVRPVEPVAGVRMTKGAGRKVHDEIIAYRNFHVKDEIAFCLTTIP
jgi:hypothetical protein